MNGRDASRAVPPLVLLVDDNRDTREMYALVLSWSGFRVEQAGDGRRALEQATRLRPDVVVTDLVLPGLDGLQLCQQLKESRTTSEVPVVIVTGHSDPATLAGALNLGVARVLLKPCLPEQLAKEINLVLGRSPERIAAGEPARHVDRERSSNGTPTEGREGRRGR
jgi:DNA-binding response OmpR family regulator